MDRLRDRALFRGDVGDPVNEKLRSIVEQEMERHRKGENHTDNDRDITLSLNNMLSLSYHAIP